MKRTVDDLAWFGGPPAFAQPMVVGRPNTGDRARLYKRLDGALDSGWLTHCGPLVREFEQQVAEVAGVRHCVATCNATIALSLLVQAAGLTGEVIMPAMTYVATPHSMRYPGLRPVFCDIDPVTGCIDPDQVEALVTARTSAIIGVHLWGQACDVPRLAEIARRRGLALFFDAAQGVGCTFGDRPIGGFGQAEVFSFHATKVVNAFEGGAVVTDDDDFAERVRAAHNFGRRADGGIGSVGTNAKMTEGSAAMGLTSLEALPESVAQNRVRYDMYRAALADIPGIEVHRYDERHRNNHQYLVVKVDAAVTGLHRDALLDLLVAENVMAQCYFSPGCHQLEPYVTESPVSLPMTERLAGQVLALPTGPSVSGADVSAIADLIRFAVRQGPLVQSRTTRTLVTAVG
ncbi:DegT/DnrJ/EryC1/StrS family aminotransferase [Actinocrispum wychmicini]|uniref:dTDP-4-amino-4,6-dideoxyglucose n=1 Tax=Actinocrispum wychmicini TaxID=1213861 RepID=A0A4V2S3K1_9PSEU|nr:DegT/DnrJ/EryC1/StrS family aminotransferase [Actinocrispum wychmicini]TCO44770.1 dTDP-4-amino-4,6-dideoxyglucose [Actinocrispum wychmicini]